MGICKGLWRFARIHETLGEDLQDFGRGFMGFARIHKDEILGGFGFTRICETLGEDLQDFGRGFARICKDL